MKRRHLIALVLLIFAALFVYRYVNPSPYQLPPLEPDASLYRIEDSAGNRLYLLGSMHYGAKPMKLDGKTQAAYDNSTVLCAEIRWDIQDAQSVDAILRKNPASDLQQPDFLQAFAEIDKAYRLIDKNSLNYNVWAIYTFATAEVMNDIGLTEQYGVDMTVLQHAKKDGKTIVVLEDWDTRARRLEKMTQTEVPTQLINDLVHRKIVADTLAAQVFAYNNGTYAEQYMLTDEHLFMYEERLSIPPALYKTKRQKEAWETYRKDSIFDRNAYMFEKLHNLMQRENTFAVIGIEHLYGGSGLLAKFEAGGCTVTKA